MGRTEEDKLSSQRRQYSRSDVKINAQIRISGGAHHKVRIVDLSCLGFQMECLVFIPSDRPVYLTMPGFAPISSRIAWANDWHDGCFFEYKLHEAIYDHIVASHPGIIRSVA